MKKFICTTRKKRFSCFLLALVMCILGSTTAFAASAETAYPETNNIETNNEVSSNNATFEKLSDTDMTREEALAILGLTEEEFGDGELYVMTQDVTLSEASTRGTITLGSGDNHAFPWFTFTNGNVGSNWMAFTSDKAVYGANWSWQNPTDRNEVILKMSLVDSWGLPVDSFDSYSGWGSGDIVTAHSDLVDVSSSTAYHLTYETRYCYYVEQFPDIVIRIRVVVGGI